MAIKNNENPVMETVAVNRSQIEHRATWMGLIYDEMKKEGLDAEGIIRRAIKRTGCIHGEGFRKQCADPADGSQFCQVFLGTEDNVGPQTFGMDHICSDRDNVSVEFHYCALVSAWKKLGFDDETCALLCDIAMDGDRGFAEAMGMTLNLTDTIAKGCETCKLHFYK